MINKNTILSQTQLSFIMNWKDILDDYYRCDCCDLLFDTMDRVGFMNPETERIRCQCCYVYVNCVACYHCESNMEENNYPFRSNL